MNNNLTIRKQIIIPDDCPEHISKEYSDIELAGILSKDKNNFEIFEKLLLKTNKNERIVNECLMKIIGNFYTSICADTIKILIKHGADINYKKSNNWTSPIYSCIYSKNIKKMELLLENGADINMNSCFGYSPLTYLMEICNGCDYEIIKLLIRKGAQINYQNINGLTPLMIYFRWTHNDYVKLDIIKLFLDNKTDIYVKDKKGKNTLNYCKNKDNMHYSLIFNYKNLENDNFCECDINFIYCRFMN